MSDDDIEVWYRGETISYVLTVQSDGAGVDLSSATAIELQLKAEPGDADPPLVALSMATGEIVPRTQTGDDVGKADITVPYDTLMDDATPAGTYWIDVVVLFPASPQNIRRVPIKPRRVRLKDLVNQP
jgi:hypothetical protein